MEKMKSTFELRDANIFLYPSEQTFKDEGIFGLGKSYFNPSTNTVQITGYSSNPSEIFNNDALVFLPPGSTFCHEIGHYQLTLNSRLGTIIKDLNAILDGLCLVITKRMIKRHKRVWIPFSNYKSYPKKSKKIEKIINIALNIEALENKLIDSWQITQELFAYSWTGFISTIFSAIWRSVIGEKEKEEFLLHIMAFGLHNDYSRVNDINEKLRCYFDKKGLTLEEIGEKEVKEMFDELPRIFSKESDLIESFLNIEGRIEGTHKEVPRRDISKIFDRFMNDYKENVDKDFQKEFEKHNKALNLFRKHCKGNVSDFLIFMFVLGAISSLYAPVIEPKSLIKSAEIEKKILAELSEDSLSKILKNGIDITNPNSILSLLTLIQAETNSININEIKEIPLSSVLGTRQWFDKLILNIDLKRNERKFIKNMLVGNRTIDQYQKIWPMVGGLLSMIPISVKFAIRLFFKLKKRLKKKKWGKSFFEYLEKICITDSKVLFRIIEIYQDAFLSPIFSRITQKEGKEESTYFSKPPFAVYNNGKETILYSDKNLSSSVGTLSIYKHIIGSMKELFFKGKTPTVFCPISYLKDHERLCDLGVGKCWFFRLLEMSSKQENLLICCKNEKAHFLQIHGNTVNPVMISDFKIDDRAAEMQKEEIEKKEDIITRIWETQSQKMNEIFKKNKSQPAPAQKENGSFEYDGEVSDLSRFLERKIKRRINFVIMCIRPIFWIIVMPFKIDFKMRKITIRLKRKKSTSSLDRAQGEIYKTLMLVHNYFGNKK